MSQDLNRRIILAGFLIVTGIVLLLRNLNLLPGVPAYLFSWPMVMILFGSFILLAKQRIIPGLFFIGVGLYLLLPDITGIYIDSFRNFWPLFLIIMGIVIALRANSSSWYSRHKSHKTESGLDWVDIVSLLHKNKIIISSQNFKGGKITNILGATEINLLNAKLSSGKNYLDIVTLFGGTTLIVPNDWNIDTNGLSVFSGFSDKRETKYAGPDEPVLFIKGTSIFGGAEIINHK